MENLSKNSFTMQDALTALKMPPHNSEAEIGILSAFLLDNSLIEKFIDSITKNDFFIYANKCVFESIDLVFKRRGSIDIVMLQEDLIIRGIFDDIGGQNYLISLQDNFLALGFVEQYIRIVKDKTYLRGVINSCNNLLASCYENNDDEIVNTIDKAEKMFFEMSQSRVKKGFMGIDHWLKRTFDDLATIKTVIKGVIGIPSGFRQLDEITSGFQKGDLVVLAARPSMGKTALALCIARNAAQYNFAVGIISLEMSAEQLVMRLLSCEARVKLFALRAGLLSSEDWFNLTSAAARLSNMKIFIDDSAIQSLNEIRTKARKLVAEQQIKILIVDYLQLLNSSRKHESRHNEVSEISRFLKGLAKELNIPIIALSQLSRGVESRVDKRPILSDLRDSGAIEQDADLILFLYRHIVYAPETDNPDLSEIIVGKHRNGPTGTVNVRYEKTYTLFEDFEE